MTDCSWLNYTSSCTDLTNIATMQIEIIIGVLGAIFISYFFIRRENNKKELRGKRLTKVIIRDGIIPLRHDVREFIKLLINETQTGRTTKPEDLAFTWERIKTWKNRISPLYAVSGEGISTDSQVLLSKILEDLELKLNFRHIEFDQSELHGLDMNLTKYLKNNKESVKDVNNEAKKMMQEKIDKTSNKILKKRYQDLMTDAEKTIEDILQDD
jgi:hypothetical protein